MKLHIKSFIALLLLGLTFVSCNNDFDEDFHFSYPNQLTTGAWVSQGDMAKSYTVNITANAKGVQVCDIVETVSDFGIANVFADGEVSYNPKTGIIHVEFANSPYGEGVPAVAEISFMSDGKRMVSNLYEKKGDGSLVDKGNFTVYPAEVLPVNGVWSFGEGKVMTLFADGSVSVLSNGKADKGTFVQEGANIVVTTEGGATYNLVVNEKSQVLLVDGGVQTLMTRVVDQLDDWQVVATGTYNNALMGPRKGLKLLYSPSRRVGKIPNFAEPGSELSFYWILGDMKVLPTADLFNSNWLYEQDGQVLGYVYAAPVPITEDGATALFDGAQFYFGHQWLIPGIGSFGAALDTYVLD